MTYADALAVKAYLFNLPPAPTRSTMPERSHPASTGNQASMKRPPKLICNATSAGLIAAPFTRTISAFCDSLGSGCSMH